MQSMLSGLPCCLNCQDFLPPWALQKNWIFETHGTPSEDGKLEIIDCVHIPVCARCQEFDSMHKSRAEADGLE